RNEAATYTQTTDELEARANDIYTGEDGVLPPPSLEDERDTIQAQLQTATGETREALQARLSEIEAELPAAVPTENALSEDIAPENIPDEQLPDTQNPPPNELETISGEPAIPATTPTDVSEEPAELAPAESEQPAFAVGDNAFAVADQLPVGTVVSGE